MNTPCAVAFALLTAVAANGILPGQRNTVTSGKADLPFSCQTFTAHLSEEDLKVRFGAGNVSTGLVPWGGSEGDYNEGTILFADQPDARLEIYWKERNAKRDPDWVNVRGTTSRWRSPAGVTLGVDLKTIERMNGRPFRLAGFGTDYSGAIYSWAGGRLANESVGRCRLGFRFDPPDTDKRSDRRTWIRQVDDGAIHSSGHLAMQALNPRVSEAVITYGVAQAVSTEVHGR